MAAAIRKAILQDVRAIAQVHVQAWRETYAEILPKSYLDSISVDRRTEMWKGMLSESPSRVSLFVVVANGQIVGFVSSSPAREREYGFEGEITAIYLLKEFQGQGLGKKLLNEAVLELKRNGFSSMYVWVLEKNPSRKFYEKMNGVSERTREIEIGGVHLPEVLYGWSSI